MPRTLLVAPAGRQVALTAACLGLVRALDREGARVAFVKPVAARGEDGAAPSARLGANPPPPEPIARAVAEDLLAAGDDQTLMERVVALCSRAAEHADVLVVEGVGADYGSRLDALMLRALDAALVLVASARGEVPAPELASAVAIEAHGYGRLDARAAAFVLDVPAGRAAAEDLAAEVAAHRAALEARGLKPVAIVPSRELAAARGTGDAGRAERLAGVLADRVDPAWLRTLARPDRVPRLSPPAFRHRLVEAARAADRRIVLPEGAEPRTVAAASIVAERGIARCVLLGDADEIRAVARAQGVALPSSLEILDPARLAPRYVEPLVERRKAKGMTPAQAASELADPIMVGTMMMALDEADGLVSGAVHTTAHTIRPALQLIRTVPGCELVSSVFFMCLPEQVLVFGDCAVNPNPTAEQLADIAVQSADSARAFGIDPRVAMLSYSTGTSGGGEDVAKVKRATELAREARPDLAVDGPLQYDAAVVPEVGRQKAPGSDVAGRATVLVFPDLDAGNVTYKAVQRSANVVSIGPMLQGLAKPVNDLSRGCLVEDIVFTIALTAIQAQQRAARR